MGLDKTIQEIFDTNGWIKLSKALMKDFGLNAAVMLAILVDKDKYWRQHKKSYYTQTKKKYDGRFFATRDNIEEITTLSPHYQRQAEKILKEKYIINVDVVNANMRSKNYYTIDYENLAYYLQQDDDELYEGVDEDE